MKISKRDISLSGGRILTGFFLLGLLTFPSCQRNVSTRQADVETIEVLNKETPIDIEICDIVDSVQYIPLETTDACLLGNIRKARSDDEFYFIQDARGIYAFGKGGHFICEIGHRGPGPAEYTYAKDFYLDRENKLVNLMCRGLEGGKILQYTYMGEYVNTLKIAEQDMYIDHIMAHNDELIGYFPLPNDGVGMQFTDQYSIFKIENDALIHEKKLLPAIDFSSKDESLAWLDYPITLFDGQCYFTSVLTNDILVYDKGEIVARYYLNLPKNAPSETFFETHKSVDGLGGLLDALRENDTAGGITSIDASSDYIFMQVQYGQVINGNNNGSTILWDKRNQKAILIGWLKVPEFNLWSTLNGGGISNERWDRYDASFLYESKDLILSSGNQPLIDIVKTIKEDDNPVLFRYYFKKNAIDFLIEKYDLDE